MSLFKIQFLRILVMGIAFLMYCCIFSTVSFTAETKTVTEESVVTHESSGGDAVKTETINKETTVEHTKEKPKERSSLLGATFGFIGDVVAFPFRLIGGIFDAIF